MNDLVSYNQKHNLLNGEDNRDGDNHNLSWNSGHEGENCTPQIQDLRYRRMKTFTVLLMLSQGIPMICAGDEFARSQGGNNNAWCQDNKTSWLDWSLLQKNAGLFRFYKACINLRKQHSIFRRDDFFLHSGAADTMQNEITWQYLTPGEQNWSDDCLGLAFHLHSQETDEDDDFFVMLNGNIDETLHFTLPAPGVRTNSWYGIIATAAPSPSDFVEKREAKRFVQGDTVTVPPFGCVVVQSGQVNTVDYRQLR